jgi:hypothetical protein
LILKNLIKKILKILKNIGEDFEDKFNKEYFGDIMDLDEWFI